METPNAIIYTKLFVQSGQLLSAFSPGMVGQPVRAIRSNSLSLRHSYGRCVFDSGPAMVLKCSRGWLSIHFAQLRVRIAKGHWGPMHPNPSGRRILTQGLLGKTAGCCYLFALLAPTGLGNTSCWGFMVGCLGYVYLRGVWCNQPVRVMRVQRCRRYVDTYICA